MITGHFLERFINGPQAGPRPHRTWTEIEEGRREAQEGYRVLEERSQHDWEAKEKHVFDRSYC